MDLSISQRVTHRTSDIAVQKRRVINDERAESLLRAEGEAVHRYLARRVGPRDDPSDLLSDSMLVVWRNRTAIPENQLEARMSPFALARKVLLSHRRTMRRRNSLDERLKANLATAPFHANSAGNLDDGGEDLRAHVRSLVECLSDTDREIVTLLHWEGFNLEQIAVVLSIRPSTVRTRYARARAQLKTLLLESGDITPTHN